MTVKKRPRTKFVPRFVTPSAGLLALFSAPVAAVAQDAAVPERSEYAVEDIIVTAQKRAESLQDVSMAISAFSADNIADIGATDVTQLAQLSPNVDVKYAWGNSMPIYTIRGVGMNSFQASDTPSVGLFVDDVFQTSLVTMGPQLFDVERIEVLRGPQGALFGRNTNGGAVSYFSKRPSDTFEAHARLDYGSYRRLEAEGAIGGPITDKVSGRLSALVVQQSRGTVENRLTGTKLGEVDTLAVRGQLLFQPADDLTVLVKGFASRDRSQPQRFQHIGFWNPGATAATPAADRYCPAFRAGQLHAGAGGTQPASCFDVLDYSDTDNDPYAGEYTNRRDTPINDAAKLRNDVWGFVLTAEKEFGFGSLTAVSAYQHADRLQPKESDANPLLFVDVVFASKIDTWSQDLRLTSNDEGKIRWILGGSVAGDTVKEDPPRMFFTDDFLGIRPTVSYKQDRKSYSIFGQLDVDIFDNVTVSGGVRGIHEKIEFEAETSFLLPPNFTQPGLVVSRCPNPALGLDCKLKTTDYAGRLAVEYKPSNNLMLYASLSRGFKGGGFNGGLVTNPLLYRPFLPEIVTAKEVGVKSDFLSRRIVLNAAAFVYDYQGLQAATPRPDPVFGTPLNFLANLESASIKGAEVELRLRPAASLGLTFGAGWLDTKNKDPGPNFNGVFGNAPRVLPNAPEFSFSASLNYDVAINENNKLRLYTDYSWEDEHYKEIVNNLRVPAQATWNARISLENLPSAFTAAVYVKNLLDKANVVDTLTDPVSAGWGAIVYGAPRTFGISLSRRW